MAIITAAELPDSNAGTRLVREGRLIRITRGLYSDEITKAPEAIVRENWVEIVSALFPHAVITGRSAFAGRPQDGCLFVSSERSREVSLPGLTIVPTRGQPAQPDDVQIGHGLYLASEQRALVDNTVRSRVVKERPSRTLSRGELHDRVVKLASTRTPVQQKRMLEAVRDYAARAGMPASADDIQVLFRVANGKTEHVRSTSAAMQAAQRNEPFDTERANRFEQLAENLSSRPPRIRNQKSGQELLPFFEAYFSNYIEGTIFRVEEAADIALDGRIPEQRPEDAHDIAGTYRMVSDNDEMTAALNSYADFEEALRRRHAAIMEGRPTRRPGQFKLENNRASLTTFVEPELVAGTLRVGWEQLSGIEDPFSRAAYVMFLVSEVHPFVDGNGRVARIMMNGELVRAGQTRVVIPTILRTDYLSALTGLTQNGRVDGLTTVLDYAQRYTAQMDWAEMGRTVLMLTRTNAFDDPTQAEAAGLRLTLPTSLPLGWEYEQNPMG